MRSGKSAAGERFRFVETNDIVAQLSKLIAKLRLINRQSFQGHFLAVVALILLVITLGCDKEPTGETLTGTVFSKGKPVYPAVIMLKSSEGKGYSGNVNMKGEFRVHGLPSSNFSIAVEPIDLPGMGQAQSKLPTIDQVNRELDEDGKPKVRREDFRPAEYKNATTDIPKKYASFDTSGLSIDCADGVPSEPLALTLE